MGIQHFSHDHKLVLNERNNLDPDEGILNFCFVCDLPIFHTPYYSCSIGCNEFFIHQRCVNLPQRLNHISGLDLEFGERIWAVPCTECDRISFTAWAVKERAQLGDFLDALCALCVAPLELRIIHESHQHELIPINIPRDSAICCACGLAHENKNRNRRLSLFYWCWWCKFWIHEECTTLPSYILHEEHRYHPLALTYSLSQEYQHYCCAICSGTITSLGVYFCGRCSYYAHIKCATDCCVLYRRVWSHEIDDQSAYWIQLPMADENTSLVAYILDKTTRYQGNRFENIIDKHEHTPSFNKELTCLNQGQGRALCNGCIQPINSAPYFSCSQCTDYLLHESCANLPPTITHQAHPEHPLVLFTNCNTELSFMCHGCFIQCNGFSYRCCKGCHFKLDVQCAFLPVSITHKAHHKRHILCLTYGDMRPLRNAEFDCCKAGADYWTYTCTNCVFAMHNFCAALPMSVRHKYDKHPLKLITSRAGITEDEINFCEVCEMKINMKYWYYDCEECNQSFHVPCIPAVGYYSKVKLHAKLNTPYHPHPVTAIRLLTDVSRNYECGQCGKTIKNFEDELAYECSECDFTIDDDCARSYQLSTLPPRNPS